MARLEGLERDLAARQLVYERAALAYYVAKRDREKALAVAFLKASGTVAERRAQAEMEHATDGALQEAEYEAVRAVVRTIETRVGIGQSLLRAQGRAGG